MASSIESFAGGKSPAKSMTLSSRSRRLAAIRPSLDVIVDLWDALFIVYDPESSLSASKVDRPSRSTQLEWYPLSSTASAVVVICSILYVSHITANSSVLLLECVRIRHDVYHYIRSPNETCHRRRSLSTNHRCYQPNRTAILPAMISQVSSQIKLYDHAVKRSMEYFNVCSP